MAEPKDPVLKSQEAADREAFDEIKRQRDEALSNSNTATKALDDMMKVHEASKALVGKVADPFTTAELLSPRLAEVAREDVASHVSSDAFAPHLAAFKALDPPTAPTGEGGEGEGEGSGQTPATEAPGFGQGPSLGTSTGSTTPPPGGEKIVVGSDKWKELIASNDKELVQKAYDEGRILEPTRGF